MNSTPARLWVRQSDLAAVRDIIADLARLRGLTADYARLLLEELNGARICPDAALPPDVAALGTTVALRFHDTGQFARFRISLPAASDGHTRLSIAAPLGMAVFGYRQGTDLDWGPSYRPLRLRLETVRPGRRAPPPSAMSESDAGPL